MKPIVLLTFLILMGACEKSYFEIDPDKVYTPSELIEKANGKCNQRLPWEDKSVSVVGAIDRNFGSEIENEGKFWLRDEETRAVIEVYVRGASVEELARINAVLQKSFRVTVAGKAVAVERPTQLKCRKMLHLEINSHEAIGL
ncbi:hypothetical protein GCM10027347_06410 [Larkinella harenae]